MLTCGLDGTDVLKVAVSDDLPGLEFCGVEKNSEGMFFQRDMLRDIDPRTGKPSFPVHKRIPTFVREGYGFLGPVQNLEVILARQEIIRAFIDNPAEMKKCGEILNIIGLAYEYVISQERSLDYRPVHTGRVLEQYIHQSALLLDLFNSRGGVLETLAGYCRKKQDNNLLDTVIAATKKEGFDYLLMSVRPHDKKKPEYRHNEGVQLYGGMGDFKPKEFYSGGIILPPERVISETGEDKDKMLPTSDLIDNIKEYVVHIAIRNVFEHLNELYSPIAALWTEAEYFLRRKKAGLPVCIPDINDNCKFVVENGEPLVHVKTTPVGISLEYTPEHPRVLLWGLHSGGKTVALQLIAHYHLAGLSGFCLPASKAEIPVIHNLYHVFSPEYSSEGGRLQQDERFLASLAARVKKGDLVVIDEFLQHASPDAAEALEPEILGEFENQGAIVALVSHRGNNHGGLWRVYSPGHYYADNGEIMPTYKLQNGSPDLLVLEKAAMQMLERAKNDTSGSVPVEKESQPYWGDSRDRCEERYAWLECVKKILFKDVQI